MIDIVPRLSVDEPLVVQKVIPNRAILPHFRGATISESKLVVQKVRRIDSPSAICYSANDLHGLARRQAVKGHLGSLEVFSLLYGILADDELTEMVMDSAMAAEVENLSRLQAEFELRLAEYRLLAQYGCLDPWDCDSS